uniref:Uncharacterized protein n=1 Tax=Astyanax mexicanus TaxID=7994 RepID=A0A3B1J140_ASTMX
MTLNSLPDLRNAEYGQPYPRNGLNLLYWFATDFVEVNEDNTVSVRAYSPSEKHFGFEWFHNNEGLFPQTGLKYYEVGSLHRDKLKELPEYVRRGYTRHMDDSNTDRIVVGIPKRRGRLSSVLKSIYVTSHDDQKKFDPDETFRITPQLLSIISNMEQKKFLRRIVPRRLNWTCEQSFETSTGKIRLVNISGCCADGIDKTQWINSSR